MSITLIALQPQDKEVVYIVRDCGKVKTDVIHSSLVSVYILGIEYHRALVSVAVCRHRAKNRRLGIDIHDILLRVAAIVVFGDEIIALLEDSAVRGVIYALTVG